MRHCDNALFTENVVCCKVCYICTHFSAVKGRKNVGRNNKTVTAVIKDSYSVLHLADCFAVNHTTSSVVKRNMNCDIVGNLIYIIVSFNDSAVVKLCLVSVTQVRVTANNTHTKGRSRIGNLDADSAKTDNTKCFACDFRACKV